MEGRHATLERDATRRDATKEDLPEATKLVSGGTGQLGQKGCDPSPAVGFLAVQQVLA